MLVTSWEKTIFRSRAITEGWLLGHRNRRGVKALSSEKSKWKTQVPRCQNLNQCLPKSLPSPNLDVIPLSPKKTRQKANHESPWEIAKSYKLPSMCQSKLLESRSRIRESKKLTKKKKKLDRKILKRLVTTVVVTVIVVKMRLTHLVKNLQETKT